jgi:isoleucyl-tRNA synthetase
MSDNVLDRWLLARLDETIIEMTEAADAYQLAQTLRPLRGLVADLSNWYVRRSRRRFWKSEDDGDKASAYATLHFVLARITQLMAPWSPFVADKMWRELTAGTDEKVSVHLSDWPTAGEVDTKVIEQMRAVREAITLGLAERATAGIKVRQPLSLATIEAPFEISKELLAVAAEELNVKLVNCVKSETVAVGLDLTITPELKAEGIMRDVVRVVQSARKEADLKVDDRIRLQLVTDNVELASAIDKHAETIKTETLATELSSEGPTDGIPQKVAGAQLYVTVTKA